MKSRLNRFITTNPLLKLISLILAITLWFFVTSKGRSVVVVDVPVGFKNIPKELEIVDSTKMVSINIEGQERLLKNLKQDNISVIIDLKNAKSGEIHLPVFKDNVNLPKRLVVTHISPERIKLVLEKRRVR